MLAAPSVKFFRSRPNIPTLLPPLAITYYDVPFKINFRLEQRPST